MVGGLAKSRGQRSGKANNTSSKENFTNWFSFYTSVII